MLGLMSKSQQDKEKLGWLHVYQRKIIMHIKREKKKTTHWKPKRNNKHSDNNH